MPFITFTPINYYIVINVHKAAKCINVPATSDTVIIIITEKIQLW